MAVGKAKVMATTAIAREMLGFPGPSQERRRPVLPERYRPDGEDSPIHADAQGWGRNAVGNPRALL